MKIANYWKTPSKSIANSAASHWIYCTFPIFWYARRTLCTVMYICIVNITLVLISENMMNLLMMKSCKYTVKNWLPSLFFFKCSYKCSYIFVQVYWKLFFFFWMFFVFVAWKLDQGGKMFKKHTQTNLNITCKCL